MCRTRVHAVHSYLFATHSKRQRERQDQAIGLVLYTCIASGVFTLIEQQK